MVTARGCTKLIVSERVAVRCGLLESFTCATKLTSPVVAGVKLITPVLGFKAAGERPPLGVLHVYGGVPPIALSVVEYGVPTTASGKALVVMNIGAETTIVFVLVFAACGTTTGAI